MTGKRVHAIILAREHPGRTVVLTHGSTTLEMRYKRGEFTLTQGGNTTRTCRDEILLDTLFFVFPDGIDSVGLRRP